jgi:catechol 2,3-dioxygenase-like lactoylglutathione lyase family enzyme
MRFLKLMPVLRVADLQRAIDWYTQVLGFRVVWRSPGDGGGEDCMLQAGAIDLLLSTGAHLGGPPALTGTLYFEMDGVAELYAQIKDRVEVVWPLEEQPYGTREFGVRDLDGYLLALAEEAQEGGPGQEAE